MKKNTDLEEIKDRKGKGIFQQRKQAKAKSKALTQARKTKERERQNTEK